MADFTTKDGVGLFSCSALQLFWLHGFISPRDIRHSYYCPAGALAGFFYFVYRQHLDETKLFKDLFVDFNARYDKLNDRLNAILSHPREGELSERPRIALQLLQSVR